MEGWRARIGLVIPSSNTTNGPEFRRTVPEGVSVHVARMYLERTNAETLTAMTEEIDRCGDLLSTADVDVAVFGCTTGSLVGGPGFEETVESRLRAATGVPTVATAAAIKRAFSALGVETLAVTTPYIEDLNRREVTFLDDAGYDVVDVTGLGIETNVEIGRLSPETAFRRAKEVDRPGADAIFISCTDYGTFPIIDRLERDLGKPVVTSNQATLWATLRTLGIDGGGPGQLFTHHRGTDAS